MIAKGMTEEQACIRLRINHGSFRTVRHREPLFDTAIKEAQANFMDEATDIIAKGGKGWQGLAWLLERRHGEQFRRNSGLEVAAFVAPFAPADLLARKPLQQWTAFDIDQSIGAWKLLKKLLTDSGCGYTNAPIVLVQGGGGTGAAAQAVVSNGRITAIQITDAGCCYTNAPRIVISSPPMVPSVEIQVSKVKVIQNVVIGWKYVLESSLNNADWSPTGPAFTAETDPIETEFTVETTGRFFRLRVAP